MREFQKTDKYKISAGKEKINIDNKVLIRLYQPIIGAIATCLYLTFCSEISLNSKYNPSIEHLLKNMKITIRDFNKSVEALMNVKLLATPSKSKVNDDHYLFTIIPTLCASDFFATEYLNNSLKNNLSEESYGLLRRTFLGIQDDINSNEYEELDMNEEREMDENQFYFNMFAKYSMLQNAIDSNVKKEVARIKKLFNVSYKDIENALTNSVNSDAENYTIDLNKFNNIIEANCKGAKPIDSLESFKNHLAMTQPSVFLEKHLKKNLTSSETRMINNMVSNNEINFGVMNVILDYCIQRGKFNDVNLPFSYITKIISSVKMAGCIDVDSTMAYFKSMNSNKKQVETKIEEKEIKQTKLIQEEKIKVDNNNNDDDDAELLALLG